MSEIDDRLARLEEGLAIANANDRLLAGYMRRTATREAMSEAARLEARLAPTLTPRTPLRGAISAEPDLGSPLMDRLRSDESTGGSVAGSGMAGLSSVNLLDDAAFAWVRDSDITVAGVEYGHWTLSMVVDSGVSPAAVTLEKEQDHRFYSSQVLKLTASWGAGGAGAITLRLMHAATGGALLVTWPWLVAAVRCLGRITGSTWSTAVTVTVTTLILDAAGTTVLAASDPQDIGTLDAVKMEGRPFVGLEDPAGTERFALDIAFVYDGSAITDKSNVVRLAEPQLNLTDEESPPSFQPDIGRHNPIPDLVGVRLQRTATQSINDSTWTAVNFGSTGGQELWDTHGMHDPTWSSGKYIEVIATGIYRARAQVSFATDATGQRGVRIARDKIGGGTVIEAHGQVRASTGYTFVSTEDELRCDAGDLLYVEAHQDSTGALDIRGVSDPDTSFSVRLVAWVNDDISVPPTGRIR